MFFAFFSRYGYIEDKIVLPRHTPYSLCAANSTGIYVLSSNFSERYDAYCFNSSGMFWVGHIFSTTAGKILYLTQKYNRIKIGENNVYKETICSWSAYFMIHENEQIQQYLLDIRHCGLIIAL